MIQQRLDDRPACLDDASPIQREGISHHAIRNQGDVTGGGGGLERRGGELQLDTHCVHGHRLLPPPRLPQRVAQVVVGLGQVGRRADGGAVHSDRWAVRPPLVQ